MKVLFVTRKWPPAVGGMETYSWELVNELKNRVDLDLISLPGRFDSRPPSTWSLCKFGIQTAISVVISKTRYDVVHGGDLAIWPLIWLATLGQRNTISVLSAHGTDIALAHRKGLPARAYRAYICLARRLLPSAVILANSRATAELCKAAGFASVRVIPLGARLPPKKDAAPEPYVLFFGRLMARKGCAWFIRNALPRLDPEIRLLVAGTVWDDDEGAALRHQRVEFLGRKTWDKLARLCGSATAIIVPNIDMGINSFEGFGLSALEAAAAGGIVLASRCYGLQDALQDGATGFLLPPGDAEAWTVKIDEIRRWTREEREAFIKHSRAIVARDYSWTRVAEETVRAYQQGLRQV